jgi:hypothetical protein
MSNGKMFEKASQVQLRERLYQLVLKDLHGPIGGEEEELKMKTGDAPSDRYMLGGLAPDPRQREAKGEQLIDELAESYEELGVTSGGNAEDDTDDTPKPREHLFPSSIGLSFCVSGNAQGLEVVVEWGEYCRVTSETQFKDTGNPEDVWKRIPRRKSLVKELDINDDATFDRQLLPDEVPEVYLKGRIRRDADRDVWLVTLFLVNAQREAQGLAKNQHWLFQPKLTVYPLLTRQGDRTCFVRRPDREWEIGGIDPGADLEDDALVSETNEQDLMRMLYRKQPEFAIGHGTSVCAEVDPDDPTQATKLETRIVPTYEIPFTDIPTVVDHPKLNGLALDMRQLAEAQNAELSGMLMPLVEAYSDWIDRESERRMQSDERLLDADGTPLYGKAPEQVITNAQRAIDRIRDGIALLDRDPHAAEAFRFANRAMWQQRIRSIYAAQRRSSEDANHTPDSTAIDVPKNRSWRTFQLAFLLLNLPSTTDIHHHDRSHPSEAIADLLWFPTGGGKTEAYLGLTAYAIGLRRLQGQVGEYDGSAGVTVLMRYTLRLLTLQQFQRATALICACETIRREAPETWGDEPFRIGLWVGANNTPNRTEDSETAIAALRGKKRGANSVSSPHQLTNCPWCGSSIDPGRDIVVETYDKGRARTLIKCSNPNIVDICPFSGGDGLPVVVVDEEIYRQLPTLLIATVDKFAQLPWNGATQLLFGRHSGYCDRHGWRSPDLEDADTHPSKGKHPAAKTHKRSKLRPPDLIIQDELHLISGALGSLVGLYETVIDHLCEWEADGQTVRPKVIASTATIAQAHAQVRALFLREVQIFPPPGLDIRDNFFSIQRPSDALEGGEFFGRLYVGICAPGRRIKATMIRVYLALLAAGQKIYEDYGEAADPWLTLLGYFNALRELGGMLRLLDDDIATRLRKMADRGLADRILYEREELTSRKDSTEIPVLLDRLEIPFTDALRQQRGKTSNQKQSRKSQTQTQTQAKQPWPLDVVVATNMISVGVDVKRLGLMVVCGQPKTTAEYIQSTSRVGRNHPGLVVTVYNWARPRDLSHYERFAHYHATLYQNVEALSVTPFSSGAIDRGLDALLVALVRLTSGVYNANEDARTIERTSPIVQAAIEVIVRRAEYLMSYGRDDAEKLRRDLEQRVQDWLDNARDRGDGIALKYKVRAGSRDGTSRSLLVAREQASEQASEQGIEFACLNSLRNVEPSVNLILDQERSRGTQTEPPFVPYSSQDRDD